MFLDFSSRDTGGTVEETPQKEHKIFPLNIVTEIFDSASILNFDYYSLR